MSLTLAALLGLGVVAGVGTGTAALVVQEARLSQQQVAIDQDLKEIETSITALQKSLTSLSELVLQNRRGLDLLFLKEGGLCAALKEECCFYADHSGVVKDSMTKLRERLKNRESASEKTPSPPCGEAFFPIITPLLGPLAALLLLVTVGTWIFQRIMTIINRIDAFMAKPIQVHYHQLEVAERQTYREMTPASGP